MATSPSERASAPHPRPRLRDLGITIGTMPPGPLNAITDVPGVRVGHTTLSGERQDVNTGVTAIHPHEGSAFHQLCPAAIVVLNGAGEMTGRSQIDEYGVLESPILITNTLSVGAVHQATVDWIHAGEPGLGSGHFAIPVVAETFDGFLNDTAGQHVSHAHATAAIESARGGPVAEGNVGGGTGMLTCQFKGGIGTASRVVTVPPTALTYTVGVLVQSNFGARGDLLIDGVPVGREIPDLMPERGLEKDGSIIIVVATDAPLSDRQLRRLANRAMLGLAQAGGIGRHSSGDIIIAFSNAPENRVQRLQDRTKPTESDILLTRTQINDVAIDPFFQATVEATSEAIANALVAAETLVGKDGNTAHALPHDRLVEVMRRYGRMR
ncbi:MAG: P1 family peptidase [Thermomicrobiales bacterium]